MFNYMEIVRLHTVWRHMLDRCTKPGNRQYSDYGGRGIAVCRDWYDFNQFADWAVNHGSKYGLDLDREDNNGSYGPDNCRFVTPSVNQRNKRSNLLVTAWGEIKTAIEWSEDSRCVVPYWTLWKRLETGRKPEDAITSPVWSTYKKQRAGSKLWEAFGEAKTLSAWLEDERCMVGYSTLSMRLRRRGWSPEDAITKPTRTQKMEAKA